MTAGAAEDLHERGLRSRPSIAPGATKRVMEGAGIRLCPLCGSELICRETLGFLYCCSPECGACFRDVSLRGLAREGAETRDGRDGRTAPPEGEEARPAGGAA